MKIKIVLGMAIVLLSISGCSDKKNSFIQENVVFAEGQLEHALDAMQEEGRLPRSIKKNGELGTTGPYDWTSGFFPGSLWYLYELTGNEEWRTQADRTTMA